MKLIEIVCIFSLLLTALRYSASCRLLSTAYFLNAFSIELRKFSAVNCRTFTPLT